MKVMTIVGTRPELIKLSRVIAQLDEHVQHILVHTDQNYAFELHEIFYDDLNIRKPDYFLGVEARTATQSVAQIISKTDELLEKEKPDAFLLLGDTNSGMAAYAAKRHQIPIFHMEAGNRCFDMRVPEEINRKLIDHTSDVNLVYTEHARRYLLQEGLPAELTLKTGSPLNEIYQHHWEKIQASDVLTRLDITAKKYFIVSIHREENVDYEHNFLQLLASLEDIYKKYGHPIIVSTHPRTQKKLDALSLSIEGNIHFLPALNFSDYVHLQLNAMCTVSDSGSVTEEASLLGFPAVTIRQAHERPEGMDEGTLIMTGLHAAHILKAIDIVTANDERQTYIVDDYKTDNVSTKVLRIIMSYTEYVNRVTWRKGEGKRSQSYLKEAVTP